MPRKPKLPSTGPSEPLWETTKIARRHAKRIQAVCDKTGQSMMAYVGMAMDQFMEVPGGTFTEVWEKRFESFPPLPTIHRRGGPRRQPKPTRPKSH